MDDNNLNIHKSEGNISEEKWLKQNRERQEYVKKLKKWLDDARLWHYNLCARIPTNSLPNSNSNIADSVLQYVSQSQTNLLHQYFQNVLFSRYNNLDRNIQTSDFNASKYVFLFNFCTLQRKYYNCVIH